nr:inositol monophosphatase family protein [Nocardioides sp. MAH-18]
MAAATAGADVVRAAYGGAVTRHAKGGLDFATDTDVAAERAILGVIATARPDDARVGEESGASEGTTGRTWLVDPLCGTLNFAAETPLVAANVALRDGAATLAAASADPVTGELFWADASGAFCRRGGTDAPLRPSASSRLVDVNCDGPLDRPFVGGQLVADPAFRAAFGPRVVSSTIAVAWVAAGRRAGYVTDGRLADSVHFAAGTGICEAAGCVVTDLAGAPWRTGRGLIAAADAETHAQLLELVRPHLAASPG